MKGYPLFLNVLKKYRGIKFFFIYDEISSYTSTGKVEKATVDEALKVIIGKNPLKYHIDGQFINITQKDSKKVFLTSKRKSAFRRRRASGGWCHYYSGRS